MKLASSVDSVPSVSLDVLHITRGTAYVSVSLVLQFLIGFAFYVVVTRLLSTSDIGSIAVLGFVFLVFPTISTLSLPTAAAKYVSEYLGCGEVGKAAAIASVTIKVVFISCLGFLGVACFLSGFFSKMVWGTMAGMWLFISVFLAGFIYSVKSEYLGLLQGVERFGQYTVARVMAVLVSRVLGIVFVLLGYGILGVAVSWIVGEVCALGLAFFFSHRVLSVPSASIELKPLLAFSVPLLIVSIFSLTSDWADRMLFLFLTGDLSALGIYDLVVRGASFLSFIWSAIGVTIFPFFSSLYGQNKMDVGLPKAVGASIRYLSFLIFPAAFGLAAMSRTAMALMFGWRYAVGALPLAVLALACIFLALWTVLSLALQALGETRVFIKIWILALLISVLATVMLVPGLKVMGAAFARVMMFIVLFMFTFWELRRRLAFRFDREALVKAFFASLVMTVPVGLCEVFFSGMISVRPLVSATVEISVGVVVYFFALSAFRALHKQDFELLRQLVPRFFHGSLRVIERFSVKS